MNRRTALQGIGFGLVSGMHLPIQKNSAETCAVTLFYPESYGARRDGTTLDTYAINAAIVDCERVGGGVVYFRPGTYLSGTIILKSNVTLYLEAGSTLLGSTDIQHYTPQAGPDPAGDAGQNHLIFARDANNISIIGTGRIDGSGRSFWVPSGRPVPPESELWKDVATYNWKVLSRPSPMLEFVGCTNLHVSDVRVENSAGWTMRYINCNEVHIDGIAVKNPIIGPNVDGMDICNSQNVFISNCLLQTADDVICIKSENPYGDTIPLTKNIVVTNCVLSGCCNGFKIGTATRGGFENITFSNSVIFNEEVRLSERIIAGIALEMVDGGWIEGVNITGIRMQRARTPIFLRCGNRTPRPDGTPGTLKGVMIEGIHAVGAIVTSSITGLPGFDVEDVTLSNIRIDSAENGKADWPYHDVPELSSQYPEARMFGRLPAAGFYCRHVSGLYMRDVLLTWESGESRPAIVLEDAKQVEISGLRTTAGSDSAIVLNECHDVWVKDGLAPANTQSYLAVHGKNTHKLLVSHCDLRESKKPVEISEEVPSTAVRAANNITDISA